MEIVGMQADRSCSPSPFFNKPTHHFMLTAERTIRLILDAATANDFPAAINALNDYSDQRNKVADSSMNGNLNAYGQQLMSMEEVRQQFPTTHPITEIA
jgi:hypothetical protein